MSRKAHKFLEELMGERKTLTVDQLYDRAKRLGIRLKDLRRTAEMFQIEIPRRATRKGIKHDEAQ
jgi:hypothetical protein